MIAKFCPSIGKIFWFNRTQYLFSKQQKQKPKLQFNKPSISRKFQFRIIKYINSLREKSNKSNPYTIFNQKYMPRKQGKMKEETKEQEEKDNTEQQNKKDDKDNDKQKRNLLIQLMIATGLVGLYFTTNNSDEEKRSMMQMNINGGKLVNENQMIQLLTTQKFNSDIIIVRQIIRTDNRPIYQNICLAKESGKSQRPISCVIVNLKDFLEKLEKIPVPYRVNFNYSAEIIPEKKGISLFTIIIFSAVAFAIYYVVRSGKFQGGNFDMNEILNMKKFQPIKAEKINTSFKDVAGMHEAKQEITQFVDFLKNPDKYIAMGAKIPKGALLTGPPGTGKTLLARACAGEAGVPFFYVSGSEFVEKYVGLGANRVRSLFQAASKAAPSIIFIDQIDAIGKKRNSGPFANQQRQNTLNQLLVNMDGFDSQHKIIVMAATNLKDTLDPALLRPGRFDRSVEIGLPNFQQRIQILKVHLEKIKFSKDFTIEQFAKKISILTPGFSGAELANICNQAAILGARQNKKSIELPQFEKATERVLAGLQKRNLFSQQEKQCLAYYESGKAVASWFTEGVNPVIKISIVPHSKQGSGYSHQIKDEMPLKTQEDLFNNVICNLAGRTSEKMFMGFITSNGDTDLSRAKRIITYAVKKYGMSNLGKIGFPETEYVRKPYSLQTQRNIDNEIERIYKECQVKAQNLIKQKYDLVKQLKTQLSLKQTLNHDAIISILGVRPFSNHQNYAKFLKDSDPELPKPQENPKAEEITRFTQQ